MDTIDLANLLRNYNLLRTLLVNLKAQFQSVQMQDNRDEILASLAIGNKALSDMPHGSPSPGDKMTNIIANAHRIADDKEKLLLEIAMEYHAIDAVMKQLDNALECLNKREQEVVMFSLADGWIDKAVCETTGMSKSAMYACRSEALKKMLKVLRITDDTYDWVINILEGE